MKAFFIAAIVTSVLAIGDQFKGYNLKNEIDEAVKKFENYFLLGVWYRANEAIVESREKFLNLYTHYTILQAEQVMENISKYRNLTKLETSEKRDKVLATKNMNLIMSQTDCVFKSEDNTIRAYKLTGYNLHNCIRMAQIETEAQYLEVVKNFEHIKNISLEMHEYFSKKVRNCLGKACVLASLVQSALHYEQLQGHIASNVTEINRLNTRYLLTHIALGCVSNAVIQLEENYNIGKNLTEKCFLPKNETEPKELESNLIGTTESIQL